MNTQKIFWADNIKFLRNRKRMSQDTLAEKLAVSRSKLNAHENGHTVNPPVEDLLRISSFFRISIDSLLKVNLSRLGEMQLRELEAGNDVYMTGSQIRVLAITVGTDNKEHIEYVPIKAKAGYTAGYSDPEFIASLPKFSLPNLPREGSYRMFPIKGDSMLPIPDGSDIIGRYVQDWSHIKDNTLCILILKGEQDFVFKQLSRMEDGHFLLRSLNPVYEPYTVHISDILEIWSFWKFQTDTVPDTAPTDMKQVMKVLQDLQKDVKQLKGK